MLRLVTALVILSASVSNVALAQTAAPAVARPASDVVVRPGDVLQIKIWPNVELGGEFPIEETGLVYLPVLGAVPAGGRSITQLRTELRARYGESMKSPVVTITPLVRVSVVGAVARPGVYLVPPTETLVDVILRAGGFHNEADQNKIRLTRAGRTTEIHALESIAAGSDVLNLHSDDWISVPMRKRGVTFGGFQAVLQLLTVGVVLWSHFDKD